MLAPATPTISGFTAKEMPQVPTRARGRGHRNHKLRGRSGGCAPFEPTLTGGHPFKIPPRIRYLGQRGAENHQLFKLFSWACAPYPLQCFVMLGTHSEPRSHIYVTSAL